MWLVRNDRKRARRFYKGKEIRMFSSFLFNIFIHSFRLTVKNHNKNLSTESIFEETPISGGGAAFRLYFLRRVGKFHKWEHFLQIFFFPPSYTSQGNRARNTRWHWPTVTHMVVSKVFAMDFTLDQPAVKLCFPRAKFYLEDTTCVSRDCLSTAALTLDCRDLQPFPCLWSSRKVG